MGYIYKVTNTVNGKVYVGQTTRDVPSRWKNHLSEARYPKWQDHSILHKAMRRYGENAFVVEELERCDNEVLDEREQYWIQQYNSANIGYNISLGGKGYKKCLDDDILHLWKQGKSFIEIADMLDVHMETVSKILKRYGIEHRPQRIQPNVRENDSWIYLSYDKVALISCNSHITSHEVRQIYGGLPTVTRDESNRTLTITNDKAWQPMRLIQLGTASYTD